MCLHDDGLWEATVPSLNIRAMSHDRERAVRIALEAAREEVDYRAAQSARSTEAAADGNGAEIAYHSGGVADYQIASNNYANNYTASPDWPMTWTNWNQEGDSLPATSTGQPQAGGLAEDRSRGVGHGRGEEGLATVEPFDATAGD